MNPKLNLQRVNNSTTSRNFVWCHKCFKTLDETKGMYQRVKNGHWYCKEHLLERMEEVEKEKAS